MAKDKEEPRIEEAKEAKPPQLNGQRNCILLICCPPLSEESINALADQMAKDGAGQALPEGERDVALRSIARWVMTNFDLAPPGSLQQLKDAVRDLAREGFVKQE